MFKIKKFFKKIDLPLTRILILISFFLGLALGMRHTLVIYAKTINAGVLEIEYPGAGALFSASNIAPGYEETKTIKVTNLGTLPHSFSLAVSGALGPLANVLEIESKIEGVSRWNKTIAEIAKFPESNIIIRSIPPGGSMDVDFTARLPENVNNVYQGQTTMVFNFIIGNESTDEPEPIPAPGSLSASPAVLAVTPLATGIGPAIAGVSSLAETSTTKAKEEKKQLTEEVGETKGAEKHSVCWWWLILLFVFVLFLAFYGYWVYKREIKENQPFFLSWLWPFFVALVLYIIHSIIHHYLEPSKWCPYFIWFELISLIIYFGVIYFLEKRKENSEKDI